MADAIGLNNVRKRLSSLTELPHSFAFVGSEGSGRHLLVNEVNDRFFKLPYLDISDNLSDETIDSIYTYPQKRLYIIDVSRITEKDQNIILKFIEEPFENIYICLLAIDRYFLLPTIRNRVIVYTLDAYSKNELKRFSDGQKINIDEGWFDYVLRTPGDILRIRSHNVDLNAIGSLTTNIVHNIGRASLPNTLSIVDKLNFKDEFDKLDLTFFLRSLYKDYLIGHRKERIREYFDYALIVSRTYIDLLKDPRLDRKRLITGMLIRLWKETH